MSDEDLQVELPPDATGETAAASEAEKLRAERDANLAGWQRTQAEFENFRKRAQKEADQERVFRIVGLVRDLLPAFDNLQRAVDAAKAAPDAEKLAQGVSMVLDQLHAALARHQVAPIPAAGQPFDPAKHEAIAQVPSAEHPPLTVLQEVEKGYSLQDRIIRPTRVVVSAPPS